VPAPPHPTGTAPEAPVDVAVIGAGIIGAACAHQLADAGLDVVVLERNEAAAMGSTGRSAAGVRVQFVEPVNVALSLASIREYREFEERYGADSGYRPVGYLLLVPDGGWEPHLRGVEVQRSLGAPVEVLTVDEARRRFVDLDPRGLAGATFGPVDGVVDPHLVTHAYLGRARELGAEVRYRTEVLALDHDGGGWRIGTSDGELRARTVVNAAGGWAGAVARLAGLEVPVEPVRRMIFLTGPVEGRATTPLVVDLDTGAYFRSEGDRLLFGRSNPDEAPGFVPGIDWDWLEPTVQALVGRFPWFVDESLDRAASWHGYYEITPDHNAILGASELAPGWVDACGFSGHGVQQAPAVARAIREEIVDGRAHTIDIDPLRITRFSDGRRRDERNII
jgi:sarcosine oxidase, subunit beta